MRLSRELFPRITHSLEDLQGFSDRTYLVRHRWPQLLQFRRRVSFDAPFRPSRAVVRPTLRQQRVMGRVTQKMVRTKSQGEWNPRTGFAMPAPRRRAASIAEWSPRRPRG